MIIYEVEFIAQKHMKEKLIADTYTTQFKGSYLLIDPLWGNHMLFFVLFIYLGEGKKFNPSKIDFLGFIC